VELTPVALLNKVALFAAHGFEGVVGELKPGRLAYRVRVAHARRQQQQPAGQLKPHRKEGFPSRKEWKEAEKNV
jgi:hypothetical protein|tara:strand:- start:16 stop:237 length:222 start_codon:yes stop_codon:yes gene_type:complete